MRYSLLIPMKFASMLNRGHNVTGIDVTVLARGRGGGGGGGGGGPETSAW